MVAVGFVGFAGFLDEVSYGERVFHIPMPNMEGVKLDGLHDFADVGFRLLSNTTWTVPWILLFTLIAIAILAWRAARRVRPLMAWVGRVRPRPASPLVVLAVVQVIVATLLDLPAFNFPTSAFTEEVMEMNAGLALALAVWLLGHSAPAVASPAELSLAESSLARGRLTDSSASTGA